MGSGSHKNSHRKLRPSSLRSEMMGGKSVIFGYHAVMPCSSMAQISLVGNIVKSEGSQVYGGIHKNTP